MATVEVAAAGVVVWAAAGVAAMEDMEVTATCRTMEVTAMVEALAAPGTVAFVS